jgi:carotenoid cleavage dioxygenase-like enzyme
LREARFFLTDHQGQKMANLFPDKPSFTGFNKPCRVEADIYDLEFDGEIPEVINGTFYRCGPDPRYPPLLGDDININGDGMVAMFRFSSGNVDFKSRYVRTDKFELERTARRALFGMYRNPYTSDPGVAGKDGTTANTNAFFHAGRLFALKEDGLPHELDPNTLETRGKFDYGGRMKSLTATAHPKVDPQTGEMLSHGYEARGLATRDVALQVMSKEGELTREDFFLAPYVSFMHDWAVTADYFIFPITPTTADEERMRNGGPHWMYRSDLNVEFGIMRRDAEVKDLRWFKIPNCSIGYIMNAFNEGDKVYVDVYVSECNQFPFIENADGSPFDRDKATPRLTRFVFDLSKPGNNYEFEVIFDTFMEMPIIDSRYALNPYRYAFSAILDFSKPLNVTGTLGYGWNTITHLDIATRKIERFYVGDNITTGEPCFVPRSSEADERDGYVMAVLTNYDEAPHSELIIIDTQHFSEGPIARILMPLRLHSAVHGNWVPAELVSQAV